MEAGLIIRTADLGPEGLRIETPLAVGLLTPEAHDPIRVSDALVKGEILPAGGGGVIFRGRLAAMAELPCARCLEPFRMEVAREFDLRYAPAPPPGREIQIPEDEMDLGFLDPDGGLDLAQAALEQVYLEIPMKPLCRPDCRGLCASCGVNLNNEACRCANLHPRS